MTFMRQTFFAAIVSSMTTFTTPSYEIPYTIPDIVNQPYNITYISAQHESKGDIFKITINDADAGTSYGKFQFNTKSHSIHRFIEAMRQSNDPILEHIVRLFGESKPGSKSFNVVWKTLTLTLSQDQKAKFEDAQDAFIKAEYYVPTLRYVNEHCVDLSSKSGAIHSLVTTTAVQYGVEGAQSILCKALKSHKDKLSEREIVSFVETYKIKNVSKNFTRQKRHGKIHEATKTQSHERERIKNEMNDYLEIAQN